MKNMWSPFVSQSAVARAVPDIGRELHAPALESRQPSKRPDEWPSRYTGYDAVWNAVWKNSRPVVVCISPTNLGRCQWA